MAMPSVHPQRYTDSRQLEPTMPSIPEDGEPEDPARTPWWDPGCPHYRGPEAVGMVRPKEPMDLVNLEDGALRDRLQRPLSAPDPRVMTVALKRRTSTWCLSAEGRAAVEAVLGDGAPELLEDGRVTAELVRSLRHRADGLRALLTDLMGREAFCEVLDVQPAALRARLEELAAAVLQQVQPFTRSVFVTWDGAVADRDFAVMQQGMVVQLVTEASDAVALPTDESEATLERWREGHEKADIRVEIDSDMAADDAAFKVGNTREANSSHPPPSLLPA